MVIRSRWSQIVGGALLLSALLLALVAPLSVLGESKEMVAYQPDIVAAGRMFLVALKVPKDAPEIKVTYPDCVTIFDRTPLPAKSELRKYYFRALKPARKADIKFACPGGEITVSIEIWSFEDLTKYRVVKGVQLPRRWPLGEPLPELKQGRTLKEGVAPGFDKGWADRMLETDDEIIWGMQPDSTIPRWHWVNLQEGCPIHGPDIYQIRAFYPWDRQISPSQSPGEGQKCSYAREGIDPPMPLPYRWKIKCPIGGEEYPSNDFANGDMTSGDFPDDGIGGACDYQGKKYGFIAELCQNYSRLMMNLPYSCASAYRATDDIRYAHKGLVAMCRLAAEYAYLATMTHHKHRNSQRQVERLGPAPFSEGPILAGGFTDYTIEQPIRQMYLAEAYDQLWPAIDQDKEIIPFLQRKGFDVRTGEDVRRFIEENLFAVWIQGAFDGATESNRPWPQRGLARIAEVLNYQRGGELMDWIYDSPLGMMRVFVPNTYFRDGAPYESMGGYNSAHVQEIGPLIESIEHVRQMRPEVFPESKYPNLTKSRRYRSVFDFSMDTVTIDRTYPIIGDSSKPNPRYQEWGKRSWHSANVTAYEHAYQMFQDPKFAWALVHQPGWKPSGDFPYTREEMEKEAARWPDDWNDASSLHDGYGLAILRSGKGDDKRAFWIHYGHCVGHGHDDVMHIGLDAYKANILGQLGYPRNWSYWEYCWMTHLEARQIPFATMSATAQLIADAGPVHVTEAYAQGFQDKVANGEGYSLLPDDWQRRMLALIDVSDDQFYYVDLYRISGGEDHWWSFHALEGDFRTQGLQLTKQPGGTLAGPEVPYGDDQWLEKAGCRKGLGGWHGPMFGFAHLYNVERDMPKGVWSADWDLADADGLHLRLTVPEAEGAEAIICDGKSPAGKSPYEMKWILLHKKDQAPAKTQVARLIEMYKGEPLIKSVRPLKVSGEDEAGFQAYGLVVELADRTDTIFASADASVKHTVPGGFEFAGRFGLYSEKNGKPAHIVLVGGTKLTKNGVGITQQSGEYRGRIVKVDRKTDTILVSPALKDPAALVGKYVHLVNPVRRLAYKVLAAKKVRRGAELRLDLQSLIGMGQVGSLEGLAIHSPTPFYLRGYRYYHGARIVNAKKNAEYRLAGIRTDYRTKNTVFIDSQAYPGLDPEKLKAEFPEGSWFEVYDYGVGDQVVWPKVVCVSQPLSPRDKKSEEIGINRNFGSEFIAQHVLDQFAE